MNEYETLWNEFKNRLAMAREYSIRQDVTIEHVMQLAIAYENHFIKPKEDKGLEEFLDEKGLE